ncbi:nuclear transport factor 2 family protein [Dietzia sp. SYD-A1]|uniref:nuclear transport factor 2 family protein n=1 Tax=Dietzia sp. SYD-A1 TaxID=2780141 RepID=UPI0018913634|nr:nuclear transport factor 2 family protein [Dietzia sp. SYD-A1]
MCSESEGARAGIVDPQRRVAEAWMRAVATCDEAAALALSAPTILYTNGGHLGRYEGHDGIRDMIEDVARLAGFIEVTVQSVLAEPGTIALRRLETYTLPQGGVEIPALAFVDVEEGLVTRWEDYKDLRTLNAITE